IMTISCIVIAYIGYTTVTADQINAVVPSGWNELFFGWKLDLDWSTTPIPNVSDKIASDGFELFGILFMLMFFKGIFASIAGPVPSYDMQRILSTRTPSEAAKMGIIDRKSTRLNSSHVKISYAVFCLKKKTKEYEDK